MTRTLIAKGFAKPLKNTGIFLVCAAVIYLVLPMHGPGQVAAPMEKDSPEARRFGFEDTGPVDTTRCGLADTTGYWVYLGQFSGKRNRWVCKNFDITGIPAEGQEIVSLADLFIWDDLPYPRGNDWKLGMIMGLIPSSEPVRVVRVQDIRSGIYWALIRQ